MQRRYKGGAITMKEPADNRLHVEGRRFREGRYETREATVIKKSSEGSAGGETVQPVQTSACHAPREAAEAARRAFEGIAQFLRLSSSQVTLLQRRDEGGAIVTEEPRDERLHAEAAEATIETREAVLLEECPEGGGASEAIELVACGGRQPTEIMALVLNPVSSKYT